MKQTTLIGLGITLIIGILLFFQTLHVNDVQNLMIIQNPNGSIEVRREGGWFSRLFPRKWVYPKASVEVCCDQDKDSIEMQFSNKTTARLNCQIGYRIDSTNDNQIIRLHQQVEGNEEKLWIKVRTSLQTVAQCVASQYTPSESVEKFPEFAKKIHDAILHEPLLLEEGIDVVSFTCAGLPKYDKETEAQFTKQKEADLAKRLAEAEKLKLESETIKTEANYKREIAEFKGKADAETAKMKTEAERQKELATIEAQKKVEVEKLEKEQMLIKATKEKEVAAIEVEKQKEVAKIEAEKLLEVAEIQKKTEAAKLEAVKLQAEQKIAEAQAKKEAIALAGEITEAERVKLEIEKETKIGVAEQQSKTYAHWNPQVIQVSGGANGGNVSSTTTALDNFLNMNAAKAAIEITSNTSTAAKKSSK